MGLFVERSGKVLDNKTKACYSEASSSKIVHYCTNNHYFDGVKLRDVLSALDYSELNAELITMPL